MNPSLGTWINLVIMYLRRNNNAFPRWYKILTTPPPWYVEYQWLDELLELSKYIWKAVNAQQRYSTFEYFKFIISEIGLRK